MAAHPKSDQSYDDLCAGGLRTYALRRTSMLTKRVHRPNDRAHNQNNEVRSQNEKPRNPSVLSANNSFIICGKTRLAGKSGPLTIKPNKKKVMKPRGRHTRNISHSRAMRRLIVDVIRSGIQSQSAVSRKACRKRRWHHGWINICIRQLKTGCSRDFSLNA